MSVTLMLQGYTEYLDHVYRGIHPNVPAPPIAIDYWKLAPDAKLRDLIIIFREDERHHRDVNHGFADELSEAGEDEKGL